MRILLVQKPKLFEWIGILVIIELTVIALAVIPLGLVFLIRGEVDIPYETIAAIMVIPAILAPTLYISEWIAYRKSHKEFNQILNIYHNAEDK